MADFNALEALINAHIKKNGVQAITGNILNGILRGMVSALGKGYTIAGVAVPSSDPGTMTGPLAYLAYTAGTYTHFGGLEVEQGEVAMLIYNEAVWHKEVLFSLAASATIDGNVGTPEVGVSFVDGLLTFDFRNMKGNPGDAAGFGTINATVDGNVGTPGVSVQSSGPDTAKNITFQFTNLKGETGVTSVVATVDNTVGTPTCTVSLVGQQLTLAFSGLKGAQGDTGSSVDYPFTIVNNLTTNDATQALSAAMGVQLESEVSQLEAEVNGNPTSNYTDGGYINNGGSVTASDTYAYSEYIPVSAGANLTINYGTIDGTLYVVVYNTNKSKLDFWSLYSNAQTKSITTPANTVYLRFSFKPSSAASVYDGDTLVWEKQDASAGLTGRITALETKTDELDAQDDAFDVELNGRIRYTEGGYINAGGAVVAQEGLCYTDYIPVTAGDSYKFVFGTIPQQLYLVFYDSAKVKVDYYSESPTDTERTVTAYAGSSFVRFSFVPTTNAKIYHSDTEIWEAKTTGINEKIQDLQDEILPSWEAKYLLTPGYYVNALNGLNANADYAYTPYIDVTAGDELTFDFGDNAISLYAVFVNDSLQSVDYFSLSAGMKKRTLTVPENATKVRFSCGKTYNARIWDGEDIYWQAIYDTLPNRVESLETADREFNERITAIEVQTSHTDVDYEGREIYVFCKGVALGDSLTKGSENYTTPAPASTVVIPKFSYPSKLSQMTGIEMGNISMGGISTADFYDLYKNDDWSGYEFAIIQLGVNDHATGQTEWPLEDKTGMENIITKLQAENEGIFVFVSTILPATAYYGRDYISQGIRDLVEELNDDHIILLDMAVHSHLGDSAGYNNGHLSALGYQELAREYASYISYVISQNKELFRKVQFIGTQYDYQP